MPVSAEIEFVVSETAITETVTKFGGQPVWLGTPQWPLSRSTGKPMRFIAQIALDDTLWPGTAGKMAYLFMTDDDDGEYVDGTWEPEGGENALIIQPSTAVPLVDVSNSATGPTLYTMVEVAEDELLEEQACEFAVNLSLDDEPEYQPESTRWDWDEATYTNYAQALEGNKLGGVPIFLQGDEFPEGDGWRLVLQLDATQAPFWVNFGDAGIGYAFIDSTGERGQFLWQCS